VDLAKEEQVSVDQYRLVKDLVKDLRMSAGDMIKGDRGRAIFLIGAGCSKSAGIPLANEIAQDCIIKLAKIYGDRNFKKPESALNWLRKSGWVTDEYNLKKNSWGKLYGKIFEDHFKTTIDQREIIFRAIEQSQGKIN